MDVYLQIAGAIKKDVAKIIGEALSGMNPKYRFSNITGSFIRWGVVQQDIDDAIDHQLTCDKDGE